MPEALPSWLNPQALTPEQTASNRRNQERAQLSRDEFMTIMIAELRHQDPLEPMSNSELLAQMSQMEQLQAATRTADGIENLTGALRFQQLTIASTFIGTVVKATDAHGQDIQGLVGRVTVSGDQVVLGLQVPVTDEAGNVLYDTQGEPVTREITVKLADVRQVISPSLVDYTTTIIDPDAGTPLPPAGDEAPPAESEEPEPGEDPDNEPETTQN
jgi:hypothetical protein